MTWPATSAWRPRSRAARARTWSRAAPRTTRSTAAPAATACSAAAAVDELSYATRTAPVVVDLATETGGEAGEADGVAGFEEPARRQRRRRPARRRRRRDDRRRRRRRRPARARRRRRAVRRHRRRPAVRPGRRRPPLRRPRQGDDVLHADHPPARGPPRRRPRRRRALRHRRAQHATSAARAPTSSRAAGDRTAWTPAPARTACVARGGGRDRVRCGARARSRPHRPPRHAPELRADRARGPTGDSS